MIESHWGGEVMVYDTVNGKHVYWTDKRGVTHKCEGDDVYNFRRDPGPSILSSLGGERCYVVPESLTITTSATMPKENSIVKTISKESNKKNIKQAKRRR